VKFSRELMVPGSTEPLIILGTGTFSCPCSSEIIIVSLTLLSSPLYPHLCFDPNEIKTEVF
jgi:hypothetical protein